MPKLYSKSYWILVHVRLMHACLNPRHILICSDLHALQFAVNHHLKLVSYGKLWAYCTSSLKLTDLDYYIFVTDWRRLYRPIIRRECLCYVCPRFLLMSFISMSAFWLSRFWMYRFWRNTAFWLFRFRDVVNLQSHKCAIVVLRINDYRKVPKVVPCER